MDLNAESGLVKLNEKGGTLRWQPITLDLAGSLAEHARLRGAVHPTDELLRYRDHDPMTGRRYISGTASGPGASLGRRSKYLHPLATPHHSHLVERHFNYGVSHAEIGNIDSAIEYLTAFLADADPGDALYRDATYQLGMMLPAVGRFAEGLRYLQRLRPMYAAEYGPDSIHVSALERRIGQIQHKLFGET